MKKKTLITFAVTGGILIISGLIKKGMSGKCTTSSSNGLENGLNGRRAAGRAIPLEKAGRMI